MGYIIKILFWFVYFYTGFLLIYQLGLIFLSWLIPPRKKSANNDYKKYLILIPAYKENETLIYTADALNKLKYPSNYFRVVLLNDECDQSVIETLKEKIEIINLSLENHSKQESLKWAIPFANNFDFVIILDADNLIHPDFLINMNKQMTSEAKVVQGIRLPKNLNSINEKLDAVTDYIYNEIDRLIPSRLNLTCTLSGSGFAIKSDLFAELIQNIKTVGGFDKILQSELLLRNISIDFCPDAIIYDEKISSSSSYVRQRKRWIYFHFYNAIKYGFKLLFKGIKNLNWNQIHLGLISIRLPMSLFYLVSTIVIVVAFFIEKLFALILFLEILIFSLIISSILKKNRILSLELIISVPTILLNHLKSIIKISDAKKDSLKTEHIQKTQIEKLISEKDLENLK